MLNKPALYLALGDSMSIDLYPALDVGEIDVAVALERRVEAGSIAPLGAASLLERNDDARYPEFAGRDLRTRWPDIERRDLAMDGATIGDVFGMQLPEIEEREDEVLATLTVGGNDLLSAFSTQPRASLMERIVRDIARGYDALLDALRERLPRATLLLTTVYDPSDRTGRIPGLFEDAGPLPLRHLDTLNARIRDAARGREGMLLADVYVHFLGHGATVPPDERWYWRRSQIEPSAVGASEIRRTWVDALELD
ncbi:MAG TPA: GDSL-type esterase/lipase family protein [Gemmatimonadaceae bacterium]|nr:GDSL-type esterase/lipase family protein [Gemmatimonadaceae bacterium]